MEIKEIKEQFEESLKPLKSRLEGLAEDLKKRPESQEVKTAVDQALTEVGKLRADNEERLKSIENALSKSTVSNHEVEESIGQKVVNTDSYKNFKSGMTAKRSDKIEIGSFHKTAIVNATGQNQPLVPAMRIPGIQSPLQMKLTIRDILPVSSTTSTLIEYVKETSQTNAAKPQGYNSSPRVYENVSKAESALGFALAYEPVQTIAHFIPASRQVLDDAPALQNYIDGRGTYFLKLEEERNLLNGAGTNGELNGLYTQATAYDTSLDVSGDTKIDTLRHAMLQIELANAGVSAFVFNPTDWHDIELVKTSGTASSGQYVFANPHNMGVPNIWGRPVVTTQSLTAGTFLTGDFNLAATLYDRMQSTVELSREHSDFFIKNMVAILFEERLALVVYRPEALVKGSFPAAS